MFEDLFFPKHFISHFFSTKCDENVSRFINILVVAGQNIILMIQFHNLL